MSDVTRQGRIVRRRWTEAEDNLIRKLYGTMSAAQVGRRINRTEEAVWQRATKTLRLEKRDEVNPWSGVELDELKRCYGTEAPAHLAARLGRTPTAVYQQARCLGLLSRKFEIVSATVHDYFSTVTTAEQAYILGLLAADGCVASDHPRVVFGLQEKDIHMVEFVRSRLNPEATISPATRKRRRFAVIQITSRRMVADLARYGVVPRKSRILEWPATLREPSLRPFLSGYFDGDGWVHVIRRKRCLYPGWGVCSGSEGFLLDMRNYVLSATGVSLGSIRHRSQSSLYQVTTSGRNAYLVNSWLHQDGLGLARKRYAADIVARYHS